MKSLGTRHLSIREHIVVAGLCGGCSALIGIGTIQLLFKVFNPNHLAIVALLVFGIVLIGCLAGVSYALYLKRRGYW